MSGSWYYKWRDRPPTPRQDRQAELTEAVWESFQASGFTYGSPRVWLDLHEAGWRVSVNTVAAVMAANGWAGRKRPRRRSLTRAGARPGAPDLVGRRFIAARPDPTKSASQDGSRPSRPSSPSASKTNRLAELNRSLVRLLRQLDVEQLLLQFDENKRLLKPQWAQPAKLAEPTKHTGEHPAGH